MSGGDGGNIPSQALPTGAFPLRPCQPYIEQGQSSSTAMCSDGCQVASGPCSWYGVCLDQSADSLFGDIYAANSSGSGSRPMVLVRYGGWATQACVGAGSVGPMNMRERDPGVRCQLNPPLFSPFPHRSAIVTYTSPPAGGRIKAASQPHKHESIPKLLHPGTPPTPPPSYHILQIHTDRSPPQSRHQPIFHTVSWNCSAA